MLPGSFDEVPGLAESWLGVAFLSVCWYRAVILVVEAGVCTEYVVFTTSLLLPYVLTRRRHQRMGIEFGAAAAIRLRLFA